jgi:hypothetical protein
MEGPSPSYRRVSKDPWDWVCFFSSVVVRLGYLTRISRERTATNLVNAGAASVSDLSLPQYASLLTPAQKVGVLYGDHMTRPIPRAEAEEIAVRANSCVIVSLVRIILTIAKGLHSPPHLLQL